MFWGVGKIRGASTAMCCQGLHAVQTLLQSVNQSTGQNEFEPEGWNNQELESRTCGVLGRCENRTEWIWAIRNLYAKGKQQVYDSFAPWSLVCLSGNISSNYCLWWHHPVQYYLASGVCCYMFILGVDAGNGMMESTKSSSIKGVYLNHHATGNRQPLHRLREAKVRAHLPAGAETGRKMGKWRKGQLGFWMLKGVCIRMHKKTTIWRPCMLAAIGSRALLLSNSFEEIKLYK